MGNKGWNSAMYCKHLLVLSLSINIALLTKVLIFHGHNHLSCILEASEPEHDAVVTVSHVLRSKGIVAEQEGQSLVLSSKTDVKNLERVVNLDQ